MRRPVALPASTLSRRGMLSLSTAGGAALATTALTPVAAAQPAGPVRVLLPFEMAVRQGPSAGLTLIGGLGLEIGADGAVDRGVFVPVNPDGSLGERLAVVGQVAGRAVHLVITLPDGGAVFGTGAATEDLRGATDVIEPVTLERRRPFQMGGPFAGPRPGDGGDWIIPLIALGAVIVVAAGAAIATALVAAANDLDATRR